MIKQQIRMLAEQAGYRELPTVRLAFYGFDKAKFAELIVKECLMLVAEEEAMAIMHDWTAYDTAANIHNSIKNYFGVEE